MEIVGFNYLGSYILIWLLHFWSCNLQRSGLSRQESRSPVSGWLNQTKTEKGQSVFRFVLTKLDRIMQPVGGVFLEQRRSSRKRQVIKVVAGMTNAAS